MYAKDEGDVVNLKKNYRTKEGNWEVIKKREEGIEEFGMRGEGRAR